MDHRERFVRAMQGEELYPAPAGVTGGGIYPLAEARLCGALGLAERDHEGVKLALGAVDRWAAPAYAGPVLEEAPFQHKAAFPHARVVRSIGGSWEGIESYGEEFDHPLEDAETVADVDAHGWPSPDLFDYDTLHWFTDPDGENYSPAEFARRRAGFARFIGGWSPIFSRIMDLCGMETGLMHMAARPDLIEAMTVRIGDFLEGYYRRMAEACRGYADVVVFGDDFAAQNGLLLRPDSWSRHFLPTWKRLFAVAHDNGMLALMHSCGAVRDVLPGLVDAGLDILEVVQVRACLRRRRRGAGPGDLAGRTGGGAARPSRGAPAARPGRGGAPIRRRREGRRSRPRA